MLDSAATSDAFLTITNFAAASTSTPPSTTAVDSALATGTLDPSHTSTLAVTYDSFPTPWPILLVSILITIITAHIGWRSQFRSWHPHADMQRLMPEPGTDLYYAMEAKIPKRRDSNGKNIRPSRWELAALQDEVNYDPNDDIQPHGGVGYGRMVLTLFGAAWTTWRVVFSFILVLVSTFDVNSSLPDPWSIIVLLIVCQIYLSSRGFPRAINLLMAFNIAIMFVAFMLSTWGPRASTNYYGKMIVTGGNCPFFWGGNCPLNFATEQINKNMTVVGCLTNSTWNQEEMGYPREAFFDPATGPDPNQFTIMYQNRMIVKIGGLVLAIFTITWTLYLMLRTRPWIDMRYPMPELKFARFGNFASNMAMISYVSMWLFILWALISHLFDEVRPDGFNYVDSMGPPVNISVFTYMPGSTGWDQSHDGSDAYANFYGGNSTTWSDCFNVKVSASASGHISEWWNERESKALRILAQI